MPLTPEEKNRIYEEEKERILAQEKINAELEEEKERKLAREKIKAELKEEKEQELAQEKINAELKEEKTQKAGKKSNKGCMVWLLTFLLIIIAVNLDSIVHQLKFHFRSKDSKVVRNSLPARPKQAEEEKAKDLKADQRSLIPYTVINRSEAGTAKVSYDLRVDIVDGGLPTTEELADVAGHLKSKESYHDRTFVLFYLPGMVVDAGAFASAHHNPTLEVKIIPFFLPERYRELLNLREKPRGGGAREKSDPDSGVRSFDGHIDLINSIAWSPDGTKIASGGQDELVKVWDGVKGDLLATKGHSGNVTSVDWAPDGKRLASCSGVLSKGIVRIWDALSGENIHSFNAGMMVGEAVWSPNGKKLAACGGFNDGDYIGAIKIWATDSGRNLLTLKKPKGLQSVAWSPDGTKLAAGGGGDNAVRVWDANTGEKLHNLIGHSDTIWSVKWSFDGSKIASGGWDKKVIIWDATLGKSLRTIGDNKGKINSVAWSPDGSKLASCSTENTVKVWDATNGEEIQALGGFRKSVQSVAWSPSGTMLATGGWFGSLKIWSFQKSLRDQ